MKQTKAPAAFILWTDWPLLPKKKKKKKSQKSNWTVPEHNVGKGQGFDTRSVIQGFLQKRSHTPSQAEYLWSITRNFSHFEFRNVKKKKKRKEGHCTRVTPLTRCYLRWQRDAESCHEHYFTGFIYLPLAICAHLRRHSQGNTRATLLKTLKSMIKMVVHFYTVKYVYIIKKTLQYIWTTV